MSRWNSLVETVLRLAVAARIADQALGQPGILDAVFPFVVDDGDAGDVAA
jgi:hypothetical protein